MSRQATGSSDVPAVNDDGTAEEVLEGVDAAPQFQEELRLLWHAVVRPAHELNVGHLPLGVLLLLLQTRPPTHEEVRKHTGALACSNRKRAVFFCAFRLTLEMLRWRMV